MSFMKSKNSRRYTAIQHLFSSPATLKKNLKDLIASLYEQKERKTQKIPMGDLLDCCSRIPICQTMYIERQDGHLTHQELLLISSLVSYFKPKNLLEIGTFDGLSTLHLALNSPLDSKIHTLDISSDQLVDKNLLAPSDLKYILEPSKKKKLYKETAFVEKIIEHEGHSLFFSFSQFQEVDFVFIDGGHHFQIVKNDTEKSLSILKPGGIILWHDYSPNQQGVYNYLNQLSSSLSLLHLKGTSLVFYKKN